MNNLKSETFDNSSFFPNDKNTSYNNLMKEIDEMIYISKAQISQVQVKINSPQPKVQNVYSYCGEISKISEVTSNSEIKSENGVSNISISDLNLESENLKLQSALTLERVNSHELSMKLKCAEKEIEKLKKQLKDNEILNFNTISEYKDLLNKNEKKYLLEIKSIETNNNHEKENISELYTEKIEKLKKEIEKTKKEVNIIKTMVKTFFNFYNKNLNLCNELNIIQPCCNSVKYDEFDNSGENNFSKIKLVLETIDKLMQKLIIKNQELINKKQLNDANIIEIDNLKHENELLKSQLQKFVNK